MSIDKYSIIEYNLINLSARTCTAKKALQIGPGCGMLKVPNKSNMLFSERSVCFYLSMVKTQALV